MVASERILLVQLADIGDLVLCTPALAALREARPDAELCLLAAELALPILPDGLVDHVIPFQRGGWSASRAMLRAANWHMLLRLRSKPYTTVVFFHHFSLLAGLPKFWLIARACGARRRLGLQNERSGFLTDGIADAGFGARHQAQYWLDLVALLGADSAPRAAQVRRSPLPYALRRRAGQARIVIHPGSGGGSLARRWPPQRFLDLARGLQAHVAAEIILVGTGTDGVEPLAQALGSDCVNLAGSTNLPQLADVIAGADLFIGADSGVMHIAAATGTAVLSLFGPSNADAWRPWAPNAAATVLRSAVACSPCSYVGQDVGARAGCRARTCQRLISVQQTLDAALAMLQGRTPPPAPAIDRRPPSQRQTVLGIPIDTLSYDSWLAEVEAWVAGGGSARQVCTVNPEFIMIARGDAIFRVILQRAALCLADGVGLLWASRRLGSPLPQRVTGADGLPLLAQRAAEKGWSLYLLGAGAGVAEQAARALKVRYPGLRIAGCFGGSPAAAEEDALVARVNASGADILLVAYGAPQQDKWIARNLPRLQVSVAMGVGGAFDFIAGKVPRAPRWMQQRGLEWLFRLLRQPWRLRRMTRLPRFVLAVWWQARYTSSKVEHHDR